MTPRARRRGTTLLEVVVGAALSSVFLGGVYLASTQVGGSMHQSMRVAAMQSESGGALQRLSAILADAQGSSLSLPFTGEATSASRVEFRTVLGFEDGSPVFSETQRVETEWTETDPPNGQDDDGDGLVDELRLVWVETADGGGEVEHVLLDGLDATFSGEVADNRKDDNGNGLVDEVGFVVTRESETRLTVRLSIGTPVAGERLVHRTGSRVIRLYN